MVERYDQCGSSCPHSGPHAYALIANIGVRHANRARMAGRLAPGRPGAHVDRRTRPIEQTVGR